MYVLHPYHLHPPPPGGPTVYVIIYLEMNITRVVFLRYTPLDQYGRDVREKQQLSYSKCHFIENSSDFQEDPLITEALQPTSLCHIAFCLAAMATKNKQDNKLPASAIITYNLTMLTVKEMMKNVRLQEEKHAYMKLSTTKKFGTWKAQLLPLALVSEEDHKEMLTHAQKTKEPDVFIHVHAISEARKMKKENKDRLIYSIDESECSDDNDNSKKKKKKAKMKTLKASNINVINMPINDNIHVTNQAVGAPDASLTLRMAHTWSLAMHTLRYGQL
ncbi:uncharacterized protein LAESUDRAFT_718095 [Laetiporus sulphureus 93-53]|uniref:Uncharacterized protein n=1 Tax=Laetiporus sulphureus 93-53 TaxID=1314785 RepID=A0A165B8G1_9APHY|nr:uncharacterized protein LAESUDRAFT_718095 [Laetiporus sulphureus 93-53]KZT00484.1 hypothetical protein LAESUDRAFT_718095 [Laetiporus sulphureus 93-53]